VTLELRFDEAVEYHPIYNYAKNILVVQFKGLKLTRQQLRNGPAVHGAELKPLIQSGSFVQSGTTGDMRLQLVEGINPGDALLIERDKGIDIQFVLPDSARPVKPAKPGKPKPRPQTATTPKAPPQPAQPRASAAPGSEPGAGAAAPAGWQPPGDGGTLTSLNGQTYTDPPITINGGEGETAAAGDNAGDDNPGPAEGGFIPDSPGPDAATGGAEHPDPLHDLESANSFGPVSPSEAAAPRPAGPSYKKFDLGRVDVKQLEIKGVPFRQALEELVAGCGFNVVVGDGIDNEPVYLNFTQKQLSLKSALETLCMAYELAYSVQDDAIVITRQ
jgi:hypothetical protein